MAATATPRSHHHQFLEPCPFSHLLNLAVHVQTSTRNNRLRTKTTSLYLLRPPGLSARTAGSRLAAWVRGSRAIIITCLVDSCATHRLGAVRISSVGTVPNLHYLPPLSNHWSSARVVHLHSLLFRRPPLKTDPSLSVSSSPPYSPINPSLPRQPAIPAECPKSR